MIPAFTGLLNEEFQVEEQSSFTFFLDIDQNIVIGYTDGLHAMKQAIYLILSTERFQYMIFSHNYGVELLELFGKQMTFVLPELKRRITEALIQDTRITSVENFDFNVNKSVVLCTFTAVTIYGNTDIEWTVNV
jgi:hypothetical protein